MPNENREPILVVGAGIGGLAAALAIARAGRRVLVFEQAEQARETASGLVLWPNGVRALQLLGLTRTQLRPAREFRSSRVCSFRGGKPWTSIKLCELAGRADASTLLLAREDLHRALREELARAAHSDVIVPRRRLIAIEQHGTGVNALFASGDTARGCALVGADGIHSRVRRALFGDMPLHFLGRTTFRGVVGDQRLLPLRADFIEHHGPGMRFAHYGIGGGRSAWYANVLGKIPVTTNASAFLSACLTGWPESLRELVTATRDADIQRAAICDLPPLQRWCGGRVALLGDAAHPMTPDLGQGASQALEDAVVLGQELARDGELAAILERYQTRRVRRVAPLVRASRVVGRLSNLSGQFGFRFRELSWRLSPAALSLGNIMQLAGQRFEDAGLRALTAAGAGHMPTEL